MALVSSKNRQIRFSGNRPIMPFRQPIRAPDDQSPDPLFVACQKPAIVQVEVALKSRRFAKCAIKSIFARGVDIVSCGEWFSGPGPGNRGLDCGRIGVEKGRVGGGVRIERSDP